MMGLPILHLHRPELPGRDTNRVLLGKVHLVLFAGIGIRGDFLGRNGLEILGYMAHPVGKHQRGNILGQEYGAANRCAAAVVAQTHIVIALFQHIAVGFLVKGGKIGQAELHGQSFLLAGG